MSLNRTLLISALLNGWHSVRNYSFQACLICTGADLQSIPVLWFSQCHLCSKPVSCSFCIASVFSCWWCYKHTCVIYLKRCYFLLWWMSFSVTIKKPVYFYLILDKNQDTSGSSPHTCHRTSNCLSLVLYRIYCSKSVCESLLKSYMQFFFHQSLNRRIKCCRILANPHSLPTWFVLGTHVLE